MPGFWTPAIVAIVVWSRFFMRECNKTAACDRAPPRPTLSAAPESYAGETDAYSDGRGRKTNAACRRLEKNTPPRAPPEPYAADAILTRPYPRTTLEARADRDASGG